MNKLFYILAIALMSLSLNSSAQSDSRCGHCKMDIVQKKFVAYATASTGEKLRFDATECLVNHLKEGAELTEMYVTDYRNGKKIPATTSFYLKSNKVPSPMGANISAYATKDAATIFQTKNGGEVMDWEGLKARFKNSKFGSVDHSHHHSRPDIYAPAGVMGDHLHAKGDYMFSVRSMHMAMNGIVDGTTTLSNEQVFDKYMVAPQQMNMNMYMLGAMYAPTHRVTLMLMQNVVMNKMDLIHRMKMGQMTMEHPFTTSSAGLGDLKITSLIGLTSKQSFSAHLNVGVSVPVGSIENRDKTPMSESAKLPYPMQLGSGTFDGVIGATVRGNSDHYSWGVQQINTVRTYHNSQNYHLGNSYALNGWMARKISENISASLRVNGEVNEPVSGEDAELNKMMVPTANPANMGRKMFRSFAGVNAFIFNKAILLSLEGGLPVYQYTDGPFMSEGLSIMSGLKVIL